MAKLTLPPHAQGLLRYLGKPNEKANEDLAIAFFRHLFGDRFTRQSDAKRSDGYVQGTFVLELKGATSAWLAGLLQGVAYRRELDFSYVVVAANNFIAVWDVDELPDDITDAVEASEGAPNKIGKELAQRFASRKREILQLADWSLGAEFFDGLFSRDAAVVLERLDELESLLKEGKRTRARITPSNFTSALKQMVPFFEEPLKAVRAFYSMVFGWDDHAHLELSNKNPAQATLGGELISHIVPGRRDEFRKFVERHAVSLGPGENSDDFFASYDKALDAVDPEFRSRNGIFFTDLDLSRFVLWLAKARHKDIGKHYLVIDPACGSGNLVTNWRAPMELRHKVVSEIEPELLFAIERRMKGDAWHNGKFTVVPKVSEGRGLNFLDRSAAEYLETLQGYLEEKGQRADRPIAFLCNPPYRNNDDLNTTTPVPYKIHPSIVEVVGREASNESYTCFLAQMKEVCRAAEDSGLPGDPLLLLFTKTGWLTARQGFRAIRHAMLGSFEQICGVMVNSTEFFEVDGRFPVAFTMWRYRGEGAVASPERPISLIDLTWVTKPQLAALPWDSSELDGACDKLMADERAVEFAFGEARGDMATWIQQKRVNFYRSRTKAETADKNFVSGLPAGDERHQARKSPLGHADGTFIGFADDSTPCRIRIDPQGLPWFRLDKPMMDARKARCFSGPPDQKGFAPKDPKLAGRVFLWYALQRTFAVQPWPLPADALEYWPPNLDAESAQRAFRMAYAIAFAENECYETRFPANNPVKGVGEATIANPLSPNSASSYWSRVLAQNFAKKRDDSAGRTVVAVERLYAAWGSRFKKVSEIHVSNTRAYFVGAGVLTRNAGLLQIRDYGMESDDVELLALYKATQDALATLKAEFHEFLVSKAGLNYFGANASAAIEAYAPRNDNERVLEKRVLLATTLVQDLHAQKNFGRTKLAKLFYLADAALELDLETRYEREAAGPLDARALYHPRSGIEAIARRHAYFTEEEIEGRLGTMIRYTPGANAADGVAAAQRLFGKKYPRILELAALLRDADTEQCEIVATLYAAWNDLLIAGNELEDGDIVDEVRSRWHERKTRFTKARLLSAIGWMRAKGLVPRGQGGRTKRTAKA